MTYGSHSYGVKGYGGGEPGVVTASTNLQLDLGSVASTASVPGPATVIPFQVLAIGSVASTANVPGPDTVIPWQVLAIGSVASTANVPGPATVLAWNLIALPSVLHDPAIGGIETIGGFDFTVIVTPPGVTPPDQTQLDAILASVTQVTRRVDIYEYDGETLWMENAPIISGTVSIDQSRPERRMLDLVLRNDNGALAHDPDNFWYDKVIKAYRGVKTTEGTWEVPLGVFYIDDIGSANFPNTVSVKTRDGTKKLLKAKFTQSTTFSIGQDMDAVIRAIAINGGVTKLRVPDTGLALTRDFTFEVDSERWNAIDQISKAYGYECFFDAEGYLVMRVMPDPALQPPVFTVGGGETGTLITYTKSSNDSRLYNHVVVIGSASDIVPVHAEARNDDPTSPTRIERVGDRLYKYESEFITAYNQAKELALKFLKVYALEEFSIDFSSLVLPWLDASDIIEFDDPSPDAGEPVNFLLSSLSIPLGLGSMSATSKRVAIVESA